jgi:hypothetical protein
MAATNISQKISHCDSDTQGLIKYLQETSQISRDSIFLRELGSAANLKQKVHNDLRDWAEALARIMLVQWVKASRDRHPEPSTLPGLQKLPKRDTNVEIDISQFGCFFGDRETANAIRRSQTVPYQRRWTLYFESWGCLVCGRQDVIHAGNGMCGTCRARTYQRLKRLRD